VSPQVIDKSTVISIVPYSIISVKPGVYPGRFVIPEGKEESPSFTVVGVSSYQVKLDEELPSIEVKQPSYEIARSIVEDYRSSSLFVKDDAGPGLMYLPGIIKRDEFLIKHKDEHEQLKVTQRNWWRSAVQSADDDWKRYKNHKVISDLQRHACKELQLEREWLVNIVQNGQKCPACGLNSDPHIVICPNCRCVLKPEEYKKLTFA